MSKKKKNKNQNKNQNNKQKESIVVSSTLPSIEESAIKENFQKTKIEESSKNVETKGIASKIWVWLKEKQVLSKTFIICFALAIFSFAYFHVEASNRSTLAYFGTMLSIVAAYIEILIIRDHLWVIEGSMPESKKWRELFFSPNSIRKQKFRKIIVLLFALIVFVYIYKVKLIPGHRNGLSFIGLILMITMVYYEILSIRDEIALLTRAMQQFIIEKVLDKNKK